MKWTIGMPSYDNRTEVIFTAQALRMYHDLTDCEIVIIDNYGDMFLKDWVSKNGGGTVKYYLCNEIRGVSYAKNKVFEMGTGEYVLCMDSHILVMPGALNIKIEGDNFYQGPLLKTSCDHYLCEWLPVWRAGMWGIWGEKVKKIPDKPFEIWAMGAGFFACRRSSWLGFNHSFRGFGGETGYIQEKYRQAGRKVFCHPSMVWWHLFHNEGSRIPFPVVKQEKINNYLVGFMELGLDTSPIYEHFKIDKSMVLP